MSRANQSKKGLWNYHLLILNKYPDEDSASFDLRLKDFYGIDSTELFVLRKDTVNANDISFTNYYSFLPYNYAEQTDSNSVAKIYMTNEQGIITYKCINRVWWTKIK